MATTDNASVSCNGQANIDVIQNDYDPDGDSFQLISVSMSGGGAQVLMSGDRYVTVLGAGSPGASVASYVVRDARGASATGTINISVSSLGCGGPIILDP
ncbi:Ig-like domain-containing protein [Pelagerythrobacter sp.]|uniref:Ig-like domain-containing protein n=1 Tax=Pelagerythrobacter sp. TaxID=2800702 RepID=UPI0035AD9D28